MINIDFTQDPAECIFLLQPDPSSVYLVAKAAQYYGSNNINTLSVLPYDTNGRTSINTSIHTILDALNIPNGQLLLPEAALSGVADEPGDHLYQPALVKIQDAVKRFVAHIDPSLVYDNVYDTPITRRELGIVLSTMIHAGILDRQLNIVPDAPYRTIVTGFTNKEGTPTPADILRPDIVQAAYDVNQEHPYIWAPLLDVAYQDIMQSAAEEGLDRIMSLSLSCKLRRPIQCGQCTDCVYRRHEFIQAGINDTTIYEYR